MSQQSNNHDMYTLLMSISNQNTATLTKLNAIEQRLERMYDDHKALESRVIKLEAKEHKRAGVIATVSFIVSLVISLGVAYFKQGGA